MILTWTATGGLLAHASPEVSCPTVPSGVRLELAADGQLQRLLVTGEASYPQESAVAEQEALRQARLDALAQFAEWQRTDIQTSVSSVTHAQLTVNSSTHGADTGTVEKTALRTQTIREEIQTQASAVQRNFRLEVSCTEWGDETGRAVVQLSWAPDHTQHVLPSARVDPSLFTDLDIREDYRDVILRHDSFLMGHVAPVEVRSELFIVAVGVAPIDVGQPLPKRSELEVIAKANARGDYMTYMGSVIDTRKSYDRTKTTQKVRTPAEQAAWSRMTKKVSTWTTETAQGKLAGAMDVGSWYAASRDRFFCAIAVPVESVGSDVLRSQNTSIAPLTEATASSRYRHLDLKPAFKSAVFSEPMILDGFLSAIEVDGQVYIVAVGTSPASDAQYEDIPARLRWITIARTNAQREYMNYVNSVIESKTEVVQQYTVSRLRTPAGAQTLKSVHNTVESWTSVHAEGILKGGVEVGTWYSKNGDRLYFALAVPID